MSQADAVTSISLMDCSDGTANVKVTFIDGSERETNLYMLEPEWPRYEDGEINYEGDPILPDGSVQHFTR